MASHVQRGMHTACTQPLTGRQRRSNMLMCKNDLTAHTMCLVPENCRLQHAAAACSMQNAAAAFKQNLQTISNREDSHQTLCESVLSVVKLR